MRKAAVDTNVYSAFKRNDERIVNAFSRLDFIGIDTTVLAELYVGFKGGARESINKYELEQFINSPRVHLLDHDAVTAEFYAEIFIKLKQNGAPLPTNDIWIAASAFQHGPVLFSLDSHFEKIDGLILKRDY